MFCVLGATILGARTADSKSDRPTRLVLSSTRSVYAIREPITLSFDLLNDSRKTIKGYYSFNLKDEPYNNNVTITYQRASDVVHVYALRSDTDPINTTVFLKPIKIPPHGRLSTSTLLLYDRGADRFVFDEPGTYEFRAKFDYDSNNTIESNPLIVTVTPTPEGETPEVLEIWKNRDLAKAIQGNWVGPAAEAGVIERLSKLLTKFPSSIYTRNGREAILNLYEERARFGQTDRFQHSLLELVKSRR